MSKQGYWIIEYIWVNSFIPIPTLAHGMGVLRGVLDGLFVQFPLQRGLGVSSRTVQSASGTPVCARRWFKRWCLPFTLFRHLFAFWHWSLLWYHRWQRCWVVLPRHGTGLPSRSADAGSTTTSAHRGSHGGASLWSRGLAALSSLPSSSRIRLSLGYRECSTWGTAFGWWGEPLWWLLRWVGTLKQKHLFLLSAWWFVWSSSTGIGRSNTYLMSK